MFPMVASLFLTSASPSLSKMNISSNPSLSAPLNFCDRLGARAASLTVCCNLSNVNQGTVLDLTSAIAFEKLKVAC